MNEEIPNESAGELLKLKNESKIRTSEIQSILDEEEKLESETRSIPDVPPDSVSRQELGEAAERLTEIVKKMDKLEELRSQKESKLKRKIEILERMKEITENK